jgi:topoisomerase-4 subunit B
MDPKSRSLLRVVIATNPEESQDEIKETETLVESLMGRKAELRFQFIQENARFVRDLDV